MPRKTKFWGQFCNRGAQYCGHCCLSFTCWSLWLALAIAAALQVYVAFSRELPVPTFIVHSLEDRLAASKIKVSFGRTSFDPTGRILIENAQFYLPTFEDPVATAKLLYLHLDPWDLLAGDFNPEEFHASGVDLKVPAMLSTSGRTESAFQNITLAAKRSKYGITLTQLTANLANLSITAQGEIDLRSLPEASGDSIPLADLLVKEYPKYCRQLEKHIPHLSRLETPQLHLELRPSESLGAIVDLTLRATALKDSPEVPLSTESFVATTKLPLWTKKPIFARITAHADRLELPRGTRIEEFRATFQARLSRADSTIELQHSDIEIGRFQSMGISAHALSAQMDSRDFPRINSRILAIVGTEPMELSGQIDVSARSAALHAKGRLDPELMTILNERTGRDIRRFLDFGKPPHVDLELNLAPGAKFTDVSGWVSGQDVYAYRVTFDEIGGHLSFDGRDFIATEAEARIGDNYAAGSYRQDVTTQKFRFLLEGQLNPPDIKGWFRDWWPKFWSSFDFSAEAPHAEVDVQGRWRHGPETSVFVYADGHSPVIKGVPLEHVMTRIFVRPHCYHAIDLVADSSSGSARGTFLRKHIPHTPILDSMEFEFTSTLSTEEAAGLTGPEVEKAIAPFAFSQNPAVDLKGIIHGPESTVTPSRHIEIEGYTQHPFTLHDFPLTSTSFTAVANDDDLLIESLRVGFAQGIATGRMRIQGPPGEERLGFDLNLDNANLREATVILDRYSAMRRGEPPPTTSEYVEQTALVFADVGVSAEGMLADPYSFHGEGSASLKGPGLGEVRLLGLLSHLINFTALDFTRLDTNFAIDGKSLEFNEVSLTGPNAAISAHGSYALDERTLDFNARIFPFQESKFVLKTVVGAVLAPLSNVLEVKLTGSLSKPSWAFVIGPTNFLRNLTQKPAKVETPELPKTVPLSE